MKLVSICCAKNPDQRFYAVSEPVDITWRKDYYILRTVA